MSYKLFRSGRAPNFQFFARAIHNLDAQLQYRMALEINLLAWMSENTRARQDGLPAVYVGILIPCHVRNQNTLGPDRLRLDRRAHHDVGRDAMDGLASRLSAATRTPLV
jgi:hypothetical protein